MEAKVQRVSMPATEDRLAQAILLILRLSHLLELKVTPSGIEVRRGVEDDDPVLPETVLEVAKGLAPPTPDLPFLLNQFALDALPDAEEAHQLTTLVEMTRRVSAQRLKPCAWYVAEGDTLDRYLAQPEGTLPSNLFGIPVYYVSEDQLPEHKLILLASPTGFLVDASYGVIADVGG